MGSNASTAFDLHDDFIFDNDVEPIAAIEIDLFVRDRQRSLFFEPQTSLLHFVCEARFVGRFEKTGAEVSVNLDGRADDAP